MKDFMKKNHFFTCSKICTLALCSASALFLASCAKDGYDDESFDSGVSNVQVENISADDITISSSADGKTQTISWPVVMGAGGYRINLIDVGNPDEPLINDSIVDGCSVTTKREEDVNYQLTILALGNNKKNNTDAAQTTVKTFSTFTPAKAIIPAGTDLCEYFEANPVEAVTSDNEAEELVYDLEPGGSYSINSQLNFNFRKVILRTGDKNNHATVTFGENGGFIASNDLSLNYLTIDASASKKPFIELYNYSEAPDGILEKPGNYYLIDFIRLQNSTIHGVVGNLIYDNNKSWCVVTLLINNVLMSLATETTSIKNESFISFQGGGAKDFTISNSTIYQTGEGNSKYFLRYNNSIRVDRLGYDNTVDHTTMTYTNNTFYKVASGNWANYSGIANYSTYTVKKNIWVECGDGAIARRIMGNGRLGNNSSAVWEYNTYWGANGQIDQGNYDDGGLVLTDDPAFVDPVNANFTPTGAGQVSNKTGDPRWLP